MMELDEQEMELVSGGRADFSGVTATVDSTEETASEFRDRVHGYLRAMN